MRTSIALMLLVVTMLVSPTADRAQDIPPSFSIAISVPRSVVKVDSEIPMHILLKNTSDREISIPQENGGRGEFAYTINVKDQTGNEPPETEYLAAVKGKNVTKPGRPTLVVT